MEKSYLQISFLTICRIYKYNLVTKENDYIVSFAFFTHQETKILFVLEDVHCYNDIIIRWLQWSFILLQNFTKVDYVILEHSHTTNYIISALQCSHFLT